MYLEKINSPEDIKKLNIEEMKILAQEIRDAIIPSLSVQITILFKYFFNFNIYLMIF